MAFTSLKNLLPKSLRRAGAERQVRATVIIDRASEVLARIFGEDAAKKMSPKYVRAGVLHIRCTSSAYAQEITLRQDEVLAMLNDRLGESAVRALRATT